MKLENAHLKALPEMANEAEQVLTNMLNAGFVQRNDNGVWGPGPNASSSGGQ